MAHCTKNQINDTVEELLDEITEEIAMGRIQPIINNLIPVIFVGQVSPRKYHVAMNYQHKDVKLGDVPVMPHPSAYGSKVIAIFRSSGLIETGEKWAE